MHGDSGLGITICHIAGEFTLCCSPLVARLLVSSSSGSRVDLRRGENVAMAEGFNAAEEATQSSTA
jgi:hypothetical protein